MNEKTSNPVELADAILWSLEGESETETVNARVADLRALANAVKRGDALADRLQNYAEELDADGEDVYADAARTDADSIRAALNGDAK